MQQLDRRRQRHQQVEVVASQLAREQRHRRPHPLAAGLEHVVQDVREEGEVLRPQRRNQVVDPAHVVAHRAVELGRDAGTAVLTTH